MHVCERGRRRAWLVIASTVLLLVAATTTVTAGSFGLELTAATSNFSFDDAADWGLWTPSKYDAWRPDSDGGFDLVEGRAIFGGEPYTVFFATERLPQLAATGIVAGGDPNQVAEVEVDVTVYDFVIAQYFGDKDGWGVTPWLGATHMVLDEVRRVPASPDVDSDTAASKLWGAVLGVDGALLVTPRIALTGRASVRWGQGKRKTVIQAPGGDPQLGAVELSDLVTRTEVGLEAGLRWAALRDVHVEGGWRYRDWSGRDGPGSYSGPFVRTTIGF